MISSGLEGAGAARGARGRAGRRIRRTRRGRRVERDASRPLGGRVPYCIGASTRRGGLGRHHGRATSRKRPARSDRRWRDRGAGPAARDACGRGVWRVWARRGCVWLVWACVRACGRCGRSEGSCRRSRAWRGSRVWLVLACGCACGCSQAWRR